MTKPFKPFFITITSVFISIVLLSGCTQQQKPLQDQGTQNQQQTEIFPNEQNQGGQTLGTQENNTNSSGINKAQIISQQLVALGNIKRAPVVIDGNTAIVGVQLIDSSPDAINKMNAGTRNLNNTVNNMFGGNTPQPNIVGKNDTQGNQAGTGVGNNITNEQGGTDTGRIADSPIGRMFGGQAEPGITGQSQQQATDINTIITQKVKSIDPSIIKVIVTTENGLLDRIQSISNTVQTELSDIMNRIQPNQVNK